MGCPIRTFLDQRLLATSPELIAGCYVLRRLLMPRHPPYALVAIRNHSRHELCLSGLFLLLLYLLGLFAFVTRSIRFDCQSPCVAASTGISTRFWSKVVCEPSVWPKLWRDFKTALFERRRYSYLEPQKERFMSRLNR